MSFLSAYGGQEPGSHNSLTITSNVQRAIIALLTFVFMTSVGALSPASAQAQTQAQTQTQTQSAPETQHGLFYRPATSGGAFDQQAVTLTSQYQFMIDGPFARAVVQQSFANNSDDWQEAIYKFPLPSGAAVDGLRVIVGDREIIGMIDKKEEAANRYEAARASGRSAALLSAVRENMFSIKVANIAPKDQVLVEIGFDAPIDRQGLTYRLLMPLVLAPRYERGSAEAARINPAQADSFVPVRQYGDPRQNNVTVEAVLRPGATPDFIRSTSHKINVSEQADRWTVSLAEAEISDRIFSLEWKLPAGRAPRPSLFVSDQNHALLRLLPPDSDGAWGNAAALPPREVILVLDRSGSMDGDPIRQAHAALRRALDSLRPIDKVNVIAFDDELDVLFNAPRLADHDTLRQAHRFIKQADARGGTEMLPAMVAALSGVPEDGMIRQVVLATDALVGYEDQLLQDISRLRGDARIFPIAIGAAPNDMLIRWATDVGQGAAVFISYGDPIEERMNELLSRLSRPALTDIKITWHGAMVETLPSAIPDLFYGEPLQVSAKLDQQPQGVTVTGRLGEREWSYSLQPQDFVAANDSDSIARAFGKAKLADMRRHIMGLSYNDDGAREEAVNIATDHAIRYGLISPYTSLVAIDQKIVRPADADHGSSIVPSDPPVGASHFAPAPPPSSMFKRMQGQAASASLMAQRSMAQKSMADAAMAPTVSMSVSLPQTATPSGLLLFVGCLILALGTILLLRIRLR